FLASVLFWLDSLGSLQQVPFGAHGHASRFALSVFDRGYREDMGVKDAVQLMMECVSQLQGR
ncbi:unnamed protein product, partial [Chrysoparadoxa australica]